MDIPNRVRNILLTPDSEWPRIAEEATDTPSLITGYVVPLVAIGAVAGLIGQTLVGVSVPFLGRMRLSMMAGLTNAVFAFVMAIIGVFILALIINALAPTFGAAKDSLRALKVAVYSCTPAWVAGVLQILPALALLGILAALYGIYLLYLGLQRVMNAPQEKAVGYTAVVVVCAIVLSAVLFSIGGLVAGPVTLGSLGAGSVSNDTQFDPNTPMGKLEQLGKSLEQSSAKMDAAQKSGDTNAQTAAAFEAIGTLLGGGKRVEPVSLDQLTPFVPETFAGLPKRSSNAERNGMAGIMVAVAEAEYGEGNRRVALKITDTGGASGLLGLASWVGVEGERETDEVSERTHRVDGRLVHQKISKRGGENELAMVLGERFLVSAQGDADIDTLRTAVSNLDLRRLEALKDSTK